MSYPVFCIYVYAYPINKGRMILGEIMPVTYMVRCMFYQYDRGAAGYYRGGRRARRLREIAAYAAGVCQGPRVDPYFREGAPGLLGASATPEERNARREAAYPAKGMLPWCFLLGYFSNKRYIRIYICDLTGEK